MLERAELGRKLKKSQYRSMVPLLRTELLKMQRDLARSPLRVILIVEGVDHITRAQLVNRLNEWLDTRGLDFHALSAKSDEEMQRPRFWRYWRRLPSSGRIAIFAGSWYTGTLIEGALSKDVDLVAEEKHLASIVRFERMLSQDRSLILKFWLHKSGEQQKRTLEKLESRTIERLMLSDQDYALLKAHDSLVNVAERVLRLSDAGEAPWYVVEAGDNRYAHVKVAETLMQAVRNKLGSLAAKAEAVKPDTADAEDPEQRGGNTASDGLTLLSPACVLDTLDPTLDLNDDEYHEQLDHWQEQLALLSWEARQHKHSIVLVFEGWDAAGKGGAIRRVTQALDARIQRVIQVAAPTDEEKDHHYLWRFWRHIPQAGRITIYDRSWYGRVLVERVEGFASQSEWRRAYNEINDFEAQLSDSGIIISKFWLHITEEEQLKRFKEREQTPHKKHKITDEDWRNRERWGDYEAAVQDMVVKTGSDYAPWHLIPANSKRYARVAVLRRICADIENTLKNKSIAKLQKSHGKKGKRN